MLDLERQRIANRINQLEVPKSYRRRITFDERYSRETLIRNYQELYEELAPLASCRIPPEVMAGLERQAAVWQQKMLTRGLPVERPVVGSTRRRMLPK